MKEKERDEKLKRAGEIVKKAVPDDFYGSVKYNLQPVRKKVKVEVHENIMLDGT